MFFRISLNWIQGLIEVSREYPKNKTQLDGIPGRVRNDGGFQPPK